MAPALDPKLKQRCRQLARALDLPPSWSVSDLAGRLATLRGRPLHVEFLPSSRGEMPCGLWLATDTADYIFARQGTSKLHHQHFVLHEVGHMVCGHQGLDLSLEFASMLPHLKPEVIRRALGRTSYSNPHEQEAEAFADFLYHCVKRNWRKREPDERAQRAGQALGIHD